MSRAPLDRLGYRDDLAERVAHDLEVEAGGLVLARAQLAATIPAPDRGQGAVDQHDLVDDLLCDLLHGGHEGRGGGPHQRREQREVSGDRGLGHVVELTDHVLDVVAPQVDHGGLDRFEESQGPGPAGARVPRTRKQRFDQRDQPEQLLLGQPRCTLVQQRPHLEHCDLGR
jgi:hypothetical protein